MLGMHTAHAVDRATTVLFGDVHDGLQRGGMPYSIADARGTQGRSVHGLGGHAERFFFCKHPPPTVNHPVRRGYDTRLGHTIATIIVACTPK